MREFGRSLFRQRECRVLAKRIVNHGIHGIRTGQGAEADGATQRFFSGDGWGRPGLVGLNRRDSDGTESIHGYDTAEIWRTQRIDSEGGVHDLPGVLMVGIGFDAGSSDWASLRRKMVRGEGFEPPTNSV